MRAYIEYIGAVTLGVRYELDDSELRAIGEFSRENVEGRLIAVDVLFFPYGVDDIRDGLDWVASCPSKIFMPSAAT